ncbi:MAG: hypothetical protein ACLQSR_08945 [Limisphaerales bacterium]
MPISTIALLVIRLFCILWSVESLVTLVSIPATYHYYNQHGSFTLMEFIPSGAYLLAAVIGWKVAPNLSRLLTGKYDAPVAISGLTLCDLYSSAFVFLGLYFILSALGNFAYLFYSAFATAALRDFDPQRRTTVLQFLRPLVQVAGGLVCIFYGRIWAKKLSETGKEN